MCKKSNQNRMNRFCGKYSRERTKEFCFHFVERQKNQIFKKNTYYWCGGSNVKAIKI